MLSKLFYDFQPAAAVKSDYKNKGKDLKNHLRHFRGMMNYHHRCCVSWYFFGEIGSNSI